MTESAERVLPHSIEAEKSVCGAILVNNAAWAKAAAILTPQHFYRDAHARIFKAMQRLVDAGSAVDFLLLKTELDRTGELDEVGGPAYITSLSDGVPRSTNVEHYAKIVLEKATLRDSIYAAAKILENAYAGEEDSSVVIEDGVRRLLSLANTNSGGVVRIGDAMKDWLNAFDSDQGRGISTGYVDLDDILGGGFHPKQLVMIAARPAMGKTTLMMNIAEHLALHGSPVAIFTLEMDSEALAEAAMARNARVDTHRIRAKALSQKDYGQMAYAMEQVNCMDLFLIEHAATVTQIQAWSRRLHAEYGVRIFGLDYIQRMGDLQSRDRRLEIDYISRGCQRIAAECDGVFIVISQLTRGPEHRTDKRPQLADLKESGGLEADADVVLLIYRHDAYECNPNHKDAGTAEIIVAKNRSGPVGVARLAFLGEQLRFATLAQGA